MPYRQTIAAAYDAGVEEEFNRLIMTPLREAEYKLCTELLDEFIPDGSTVIDIGSGPGRYAEHLLNRNCRVGLVDLSARSLKAFSDRMENLNYQTNIIFNQVSCASRLDWIDDCFADAILLMGPLYHLIDKDHRDKAISHCHRILKPGGYLFAVFLSPFPEVYNLSDNDHWEELSVTTDFFKSLPQPMVTRTLYKGFEVPQFRCWPATAKEIMHTHSFKTIRVRNIEGRYSFITDARLSEFNTPSGKAFLLDKLRKTSESEKSLGITHQFFLVAIKQDQGMAD
jgi:ubiquinone/menaquinone biosynthesis C-methylase UbiE